MRHKRPVRIISLIGALICGGFLVAGLISAGQAAWNMASLAMGAGRADIVSLPEGWFAQAEVKTMQISGGRTSITARVYAGRLNSIMAAVIVRGTDSIPSGNAWQAIPRPGFQKQVNEMLAGKFVAYEGTTSVVGFYLWQIIPSLLLVMLALPIGYCCIKEGLLPR